MRLQQRAFRRSTALLLLWAALTFVPPGCGGSGGSARIGRGVAAPVGAATD